MGKCSIEDLRMELFDTLQRLKSNNDKNCSPNEKCTIEEAETVCHIAKEITETYKVQLTAMNILAKADNPGRVSAMIADSGISKNE
jgi:hypothetical protein